MGASVNIVSITQNSYNATTNKSSITVIVNYSWTSPTYNQEGSAYISISINGASQSKTVYFGDGSSNGSSSISFTNTLAHNNDGSLIVNCVATFHATNSTSSNNSSSKSFQNTPDSGGDGGGGDSGGEGTDPEYNSTLNIEWSFVIGEHITVYVFKESSDNEPYKIYTKNATLKATFKSTSSSAYKTIIIRAIAEDGYKLLKWTQTTDNTTISIPINAINSRESQINVGNNVKYYTWNFSAIPNECVFIENNIEFLPYKCYIYTEKIENPIMKNDCIGIGTKRSYSYLSSDEESYYLFTDNRYDSWDTLWFGYRRSIYECFSVRFTTPSFFGVSKNINISMLFKSYTQSTCFRYALCISDSNYEMYKKHCAHVEEENQIITGTFNNDNVLLDKINLIIKTSELQSNSTYYLFIWPMNNDGKYSISLPNINIEYKDTNAIYPSNYMLYEPYIYNGATWEVY